MRVLFTSTGGDGHLLPLLPLAQAFAARGDDVTVAAPGNHRERIDGLGLRFEEVGPTLEELKPSIRPHQAKMAQVPVAERRRFAFAGRFAEIEAPQRMEALAALVDDSQPDVVIHESADLAAPIAAAAATIPTANHGFGRPIPEQALRRAAEVIAPLCVLRDRSRMRTPAPTAARTSTSAHRRSATTCRRRRLGLFVCARPRL